MWKKCNFECNVIQKDEMWIHWLCKLQSFVYFLLIFMQNVIQWHFLKKRFSDSDQVWCSRPPFCPNTRMKRCSQILENSWAWRFRFKLARICAGFLLWVSPEKQQKHYHSSPRTCRVEGTCPIGGHSQLVPWCQLCFLQGWTRDCGNRVLSMHGKRALKTCYWAGAALWTCTFGCYLHWSGQSGFTQFPIDISWWLWKQGT